ncbi:DUF4240 domain-containing protein [Bacillus sp. AFS031507]|uniref:DUF4240 domain-containing protein n=2 Tax=Bacillaceae TaxID=186817 RepID=UPI000BFBCD9D|nr:DUF4240 domain-containing protein [Bacillus sp. AFS031507]PGY06604.1 molybdenum metabolism regulator [Bacillus sp. AFS031507]
MNKTEYWNLIEQSKSFKEDQVEWLTEELSKKSIDEIVDFEFIFESYMKESYQSHLWGAAYLIMGGCSDDSFDYFRGWLISQGQEVYEKTLKDPEFLANYITDENLGDEGVPEYEDFLNVGFDAYTLKKGGDPEVWDEDLYDEMLELLSQKGLVDNTEIEFDWEDEDDLEEMFPNLWERFGEDPLG